MINFNITITLLNSNKVARKISFTSLSKNEVTGLIYYINKFSSISETIKEEYTIIYNNNLKDNTDINLLWNRILENNVINNNKDNNSITIENINPIAKGFTDKISLKIMGNIKSL